MCYTNSNKEVVITTTVREVSKMMKKACNVLGKMWLGGTAVVGLWLLASWVDVVTHNLSPNPVYQSWNLFAILIGIN